MKLKDIKNWIEGLPEEFLEFDLNDKVGLSINVDAINEKVYFKHIEEENKEEEIELTIQEQNIL